MKYQRTTNRVLVPKERLGLCRVCNSQFTYQQATGTARVICSDACRKIANSNALIKKPNCSTSGCANRAAYSDGICNSCYYRKRRTGTTKAREWSYKSKSTDGYVRLIRSDHPMAVNGVVLEHRAVLYDRIGAGHHPCHWCGSSVEWRNGSRAKGNLVADHLDGQKANNEPDNLVPSCIACNGTRGLFQSWVMRHQDDPWLWKLYEQHATKKA